MLNYHNNRLATQRFVLRTFYARSIIIKTIKTASQPKSNEVAVMSINLADEHLIFYFVNGEHFANTVTVGKVSRVDKM